MNVIKYPQKEEWDELLKRPVMNVDTLRETVCRVLDDVKTGGDRAVMAYEKQFDHVELERLAVTEEEMDEAERLVSPELKDALRHQTFGNDEGGSPSRGDLLAESRSHRTGGTLHTRRDGTAFLHGADAGHTSQDCRMP